MFKFGQRVKIKKDKANRGFYKGATGIVITRTQYRVEKETWYDVLLDGLPPEYLPKSFEEKHLEVIAKEKA